MTSKPKPACPLENKFHRFLVVSEELFRFFLQGRAGRDYSQCPCPFLPPEPYLSFLPASQKTLAREEVKEVLGRIGRLSELEGLP